LWRCTVVAISGGLRAGDVGKVMLDNEWSGGGLILFKFSYFVIVILLLLNVILGIVLDTFAELRQDAIEAEDSIYNFCFVCSIDRQTFDRFGEGFDEHIKNDHYLWNVSVLRSTSFFYLKFFLLMFVAFSSLHFVTKPLSLLARHAYLIAVCVLHYPHAAHQGGN
jgi:hypothetical protein